MRNSQAVLRQPLDWAVAVRALPGEAMCGDAHVVEPTSQGMLLAAVDGLGHGDEAAAAAATAIATIKRYANQPLSSLIHSCHAALMKSRGVVMTLATIHPFERRLTWLGVGNVLATLLRAGGETTPRAEFLLLRNGVVGYQLPQLQCRKTEVAPGDLLVLATDGIGEGFVRDVVYNDSPQQIADRILSLHFQGHDDALVLVARWVGHSHE